MFALVALLVCCTICGHTTFTCSEDGPRLIIDLDGGWHGLNVCLSTEFAAMAKEIQVINHGPDTIPPNSLMKTYTDSTDPCFYATKLYCFFKFSVSNCVGRSFIKSSGTVGLRMLSSSLDFSQFCTLEVLDFSDQSISVVDKSSFASLRALKHLVMPNNNLESIPSGIDQMQFGPSFELWDVTGNPLEHGCVPSSYSLKPVDLLPPCAGMELVVNRAMAQRHVYKMKHHPDGFDQYFRCDSVKRILNLPISRAFRVVIQDSMHYGVVSYFEGGIMLSELVVPNGKPAMQVYHTCSLLEDTIEMMGLSRERIFDSSPTKSVSESSSKSSSPDNTLEPGVLASSLVTPSNLAPNHDLAEQDLLYAAEVYFGAKSCTVRGGPTSEYMSGIIKGSRYVGDEKFARLDRRLCTRALESLTLTNRETPLTVGDVIYFSNEYAHRHVEFTPGNIDSCITYTYVLLNHIKKTYPSLDLFSDDEDVSAKDSMKQSMFN